MMLLKSKTFFRRFMAVLVLTHLMTAPAAFSDERGVERDAETSSPGDLAVEGVDWALVIGIDDYQYVRPRLNCAVNDARAVVELLVSKYKFDKNRVLDIYNKEATRKGIIDAFTQLVTQVGSKDRVLIYYAGHGELWYKGKSSFQIRDREEILQMKQYAIGFWIPVEARMGETSEYLANSTLRNYLSNMDAAHILVVSDSCFSGGLTKRSFDPDYEDIREAPDYQEILEESIRLRSRLLLASGGLHPVPDTSRIARCQGHSTFGCYFIKFLKESRSDHLPVRLLYSRLYEPVLYNSQPRQEPQLQRFLEMGHEGGQYVFFPGKTRAPAVLSVFANVKGARVLLGGNDIGKTPLENKRVSPGARRLTVAKSGYEAKEREIDLAAGDDKTYHFDLAESGGGRFHTITPEETTLKVKADVPDAVVFVNGERYGNAPQSFRINRSGHLRVKVTAEGYEPYEKRVYMKLGESQIVIAYLEQVPPKRFTNSPGMEFVWIPPGEFMMGQTEEEKRMLIKQAGEEKYKKYYDDEVPRHRVVLTEGFYMQTTEVTQAQWEAVMGSNPSYFTGCGGDCPVERVSWDDIQGFITAMNALGEGTYRLPSEAEWEYAARAGSTTAFANGVISVEGDVCSPLDPNLDAMGWYCGNSDVTYTPCYDASGWGGPSCAGTHPVARKQPNAWGLYDMHGNVWEWVEDDGHGDYTGAPTDGSAWVDSPRGSGRVLRGGSWHDHARDCRSASRVSHSPGSRSGYVGFRLACPSGQ